MALFAPKLVFRERESTYVDIIVTEQGNNLVLGLHLIRTLNLSSFIAGDGIDSNDSNEIGVGFIKNFIHKVKINPSVRPVRQKFITRILYALRDRVKNELDRFLKEDVIEKVDVSEWVSNMVIAEKPSGRIRLFYVLIYGVRTKLLL